MSLEITNITLLASPHGLPCRYMDVMAVDDLIDRCWNGHSALLQLWKEYKQLTQLAELYCSDVDVK